MSTLFYDYYIKILISNKLKLKINDINIDKSLSDLTNGNSAIKNEIAGILINELNIPEDVLTKELKIL